MGGERDGIHKQFEKDVVVVCIFNNGEKDPKPPTPPKDPCLECFESLSAEQIRDVITELPHG